MAKKTRQTRCTDQCLLAQGGEKHNQDSGADLVPKSKLSQNEHRSRQITRHSRTCGEQPLLPAASPGPAARCPHPPGGRPVPTPPQLQGQPEATTLPRPDRGPAPPGTVRVFKRRRRVGSGDRSRSRPSHGAADDAASHGGRVTEAPPASAPPSPQRPSQLPGVWPPCPPPLESGGFGSTRSALAGPWQHQGPRACFRVTKTRARRHESESPTSVRYVGFEASGRTGRGAPAEAPGRE